MSDREGAVAPESRKGKLAGRPSRALDRAPLSLTRAELTRLHSLILKLDRDASTRHLVQGMKPEKTKFANALLALEPYDANDSGPKGVPGSD